jgi:mannose-6-phosphate isomerase-like protein (cupin superfamily)
MRPIFILRDLNIEHRETHGKPLTQKYGIMSPEIYEAGLSGPPKHEATVADRSHRMEYRPINIAEKFAQFSERWSPKIIAQMNDYHFKLVRFQGEFVWHEHKDTDEVFIVLEGEMTIHFRDGDVTVRKGELFVIPKWVEHKTSAKTECCAMLVEAAGTVNTGDAGGEKTAPVEVWI